MSFAVSISPYLFHLIGKGVTVLFIIAILLFLYASAFAMGYEHRAEGRKLPFDLHNKFDQKLKD